MILSSFWQKISAVFPLSSKPAGPLAQLKECPQRGVLKIRKWGYSLIAPLDICRGRT